MSFPVRYEEEDSNNDKWATLSDRPESVRKRKQQAEQQRAQQAQQAATDAVEAGKPVVTAEDVRRIRLCSKIADKMSEKRTGIQVGSNGFSWLVDV